MNGLGYSTRQLPVRDDTYIPINIPTVDKVITMTDPSWVGKLEEGTYVIQMFSSPLGIATST
jgi:hypothetical protein